MSEDTGDGEFDPERFEAEKYREYFPQLQTAYKRAFNRVNERRDSELVHAIDQQVLAESEPFYEDGAFRIDLPENPVGRLALAGVGIDQARAEEVLEEYVAELEGQLREVFGVEGGEPKA